MINYCDACERYNMPCGPHHAHRFPGFVRVGNAYVRALRVGATVMDASFASRYGSDRATRGTVTRVYDNPRGMVAVAWGDESPEDVWSDELLIEGK